MIDKTSLLNQIADKEIIIYGAHLIAVELYRYLAEYVKKEKFLGFAVTDKKDNPERLEGHMVHTIEEYLPSENQIILIAMPKKYHFDVINHVQSLGFYDFCGIDQCDMERLKSDWILQTCGDEIKSRFDIHEDMYDKSWLNIALKSQKQTESRLRRHYKFPTLYYRNMEQVWDRTLEFDFDKKYQKCFGEYRNLHDIKLSKNMKDSSSVKVYMAFSQWDNGTQWRQDLPSWIVPIQAGSVLTDKKIGKYLDETGENVSHLNKALAEMTIAYWVWKNEKNTQYKGLCHYRRHFVISEKEVQSLNENDVDVILTIPRYVPGGIKNMFLAETPVKEFVYKTILQAIEELYPENLQSFQEYMEEELYAPNNMVIAKNEIYDAYCSWCFPIFFRMMELDVEHGYEHETDRHVAYAAELLTSYYFSEHKDEWNIYVTDYYFGK